jgi:hypothetical protein
MADPIWIDGSTPLNAVNMTKLQTRDEKAVTNGYASLDSTGKVPSAQLPIAALNWLDVGVTTPAYSGPSYGTTLPASPVNGQEAILVDSTTNPIYQWRFRYNANNTTAYKWEFIGGPAWQAIEGTDVPLGGGATALGPVMPVPRNGVYQLRCFAYGFHASDVVAHLIMDIATYPGGVVLPGCPTVSIGFPYPNLSGLMVIEYTATITGTGQVCARYTTSTGSTARNRMASIIPVRVS